MLGWLISVYRVTDEEAVRRILGAEPGAKVVLGDDVLGGLLGGADFRLRERVDLAERQRAVERRVRHRAEVRVRAAVVPRLLGHDREVGVDYHR